MKCSIHRIKRSILDDHLILYEDSDLICINKPSGASSLDLRNEPNTGLLSLLRLSYPVLSICHRLDRFTTGVLLFAKHPEAYRNVALQFERRTVEKHYLALVAGQQRFDHFLVDAPLSSMKKGKVNVDFLHGRAAQTWLDTVVVFRQYTLVDAKPVTGRSHQVRVHLASVGCPIVGDVLYGGENMFLSTMKRNYRHKLDQVERPLNTAYLLHACSLKLIHPTTGVELEIKAPLPKNFEMCLQRLKQSERNS